MIIKEIELSEEDKNKLINQICELADKSELCHTEKNGCEFCVVFNSDIYVFAKVLINDDFSGKKPSRYVSTDVHAIELEHFNKVKSNLDYSFEDSINKALIANFHARYNELSYHI